MKRLHAVVMLSLLTCLHAYTQVAPSANTGQISGRITDNKHNPVPGATILIRGTQRGTSSDADGNFVLKDVPDRAVLVISSTGFETQELPVRGKSGSFNITLTDKASALNEVVVIGYGTQQKKDLTGAVSQIKATQLENENPGSVQDVLRGNVAGLNISQVNSASAKGGGDLQIRGRSSINAGTTPLIVLDGVIYPGALSDINPNDIATVDVLKDASSAAVFGAKAASGVVLITTKKGNKPKPTITFNTNIGFGELAMDEPLYDGPGFLKWRTQVLNSINVNHKPYEFDDPRTLPSNITVDQWKNGQLGDPIDIWLGRLKMFAVEVANYKAGKTTNWHDMMFRKQALRQDHTISLSARKDELSYYMSLGYTNNEGVIIGDDYQTVRFRTNLEGRIAKFLTVGANLQLADRDESQVPVSWGQMVNASPYGSMFRDDGVTLRDSPNDDIGNNINPFLDYYYTNRLQKYNTFFGSLYAKGNLPFGFSYQVNFTPNFEFYRYFNGISAKNYQYATRGGVATRTDQTTYNWQIDNLLKWSHTFNKVHQVDVTLLANSEKFQSWRNQMDNEGFNPNDNLSYHNIGAGTKPVISSDDQVSTGDALMARLNYSYDQRYLLTASFRRDGYSAFGQKNPRADFPSIALGWVFTEEKFMRSATWLTYGKLRASWGINGNRDIGRYQALSNLTTGKYQYIKADGTVVTVSQLYVDRLANPNLKWERTTSYNAGLDFGLFNRINGSVDVYKKSTKDLLILRSLPDVTGFANVMDNLGQVDNQGVEVTLNSSNIQRRNFTWNTTVTLSVNRNRIEHLYGPVAVYDASGKVVGQVENDDIGNKWFIGHDIDAIWDLKVLGIWQQNEAAEAAKYGVRPGDFKIQDVNGDGKFSDADRQFLGYRTPRFQWSMRNEFTFLKQFDLSFMLYSNWGQKTDYNQAKNNSGFQDRQNSYKFPYWTPDHPINDYARLYSSNGGATYSVYRSTSFIRLNNIALGYNVPRRIAEKARLESVKIYANVTNVGLYAPDWDFWDPEFRNRDSNGVISTAIPPRIYSLGLNVIF